jgi:hypothetical protein
MTVALAAALATAPAVLAAKPIVVFIQLDPVVDALMCGFPVTYTFVGDIRVTLYVDEQGNVVREIDTYPNFNVTIEHDGNVLTTKGPGPGMFTFDADGAIETFAINGMSANVTLPGEGRILFDVGHIAWDEEGNLVAENGIHQIWGTTSAPEFCAYMA